MKVASIHKVTNERILLLWLAVLPIEVTVKQGKFLWKLCKNKKYIIWSEKGFKTY